MPKSAKPQLSVKRSITIESAVDRKAHDLVGERGFSALVNEALAHEVQRRETRTLLAELDAEFGPLTEEEIREGERTWRRLSE